MMRLAGDNRADGGGLMYLGNSVQVGREIEADLPVAPRICLKKSV
jgi:hypothetical protein